jgi:hypothetical protein
MVDQLILRDPHPCTHGRSGGGSVAAGCGVACALPQPAAASRMYDEYLEIAFHGFTSARILELVISYCFEITVCAPSETPGAYPLYSWNPVCLIFS